MTIKEWDNSVYTVLVFETEVKIKKKINDLKEPFCISVPCTHVRNNVKALKQ